MPDATAENIANDVCGAQLREGTRVAYVGRERRWKGVVGHVVKVYDWNPNGPQVVECIDADGAYFVCSGYHLRRIR